MNTITMPRGTRVVIDQTRFNKIDHKGFDIYLDINGELVYLMHHRHNVMLYDVLKSGIDIGSLYRYSPRTKVDGPRKIKKAKGSVDHLIKVIEDYFKYEYKKEA